MNPLRLRHHRMRTYKQFGVHPDLQRLRHLPPVVALVYTLGVAVPVPISPGHGQRGSCREVFVHRSILDDLLEDNLLTG